MVQSESPIKSLDRFLQKIGTDNFYLHHQTLSFDIAFFVTGGSDLMHQPIIRLNQWEKSTFFIFRLNKQFPTWYQHFEYFELLWEICNSTQAKNDYLWNKLKVTK